MRSRINLIYFAIVSCHASPHNQHLWHIVVWACTGACAREFMHGPLHALTLMRESVKWLSLIQHHHQMRENCQDASDCCSDFESRLPNFCFSLWTTRLCVGRGWWGIQGRQVRYFTQEENKTGWVSRTTKFKKRKEPSNVMAWDYLAILTWRGEDDWATERMWAKTTNQWAAAQIT